MKCRIALVMLLTSLAVAQDSRPRQSMDDAWWTGPMLAASASTLPRGHILIEPYLFDVIVQGRFDRAGTRHSTTHANGFGSLTYMNYGVTDRFTLGLIPTAGYNMIIGAPSSSGLKLGDLTLNSQFRLTQFRPGRWIPTTSIVVQETLPTGKYDQLGDRPSDGMGGGAFTTNLALYAQEYFWLPNGRILRARLDVSHALSNQVKIRDVSVYGTEAGFRGHANPGGSTFIDSAWEYSVTRRWVLALDVTYRHDANTHVAGFNSLDPNSPPGSIHLDSGSSDAFGLAPAVEYSWKGTIGVLLGVRIIPAGRNTSATVTPAVAINFVH